MITYLTTPCCATTRHDRADKNTRHHRDIDFFPLGTEGIFVS